MKQLVLDQALLKRFYTDRLHDEGRRALMPLEVQQRAALDQESPAAQLLSAICWLEAQQHGWQLGWFEREEQTPMLVARLAQGEVVFEIWLEDGLMHSVPAVWGLWLPRYAVSAPVHRLMSTQAEMLDIAFADLRAQLAPHLRRAAHSMMVGSPVDAGAPTLDPSNPNEAALLKRHRLKDEQKP
jgi:hypothetical protein